MFVLAESAGRVACNASQINRHLVTFFHCFSSTIGARWLPLKLDFVHFSIHDSTVPNDFKCNWSNLKARTSREYDYRLCQQSTRLKKIYKNRVVDDNEQYEYGGFFAKVPLTLSLTKVLATPLELEANMNTIRWQFLFVIQNLSLKRNYKLAVQ